MIITTYLPPLDEDERRKQQERKHDIDELRKVFKNIVIHLPDGSSFTILPPIMELLEIANETVRRNEMFIPEAEKAQYYEVVAPKMAESRKRKLTIAEIATIIGALAAIYTAILQSISNNRVEEQNDILITQQETIIHQNSIEIELIQSQNELLQQIARALDPGEDGTFALKEESDIFCDDVDAPCDVSDAKDQSDITDCLKQDNDSQD